MYRYFWVIIISFLIFSCNEKQKKKSLKNSLPKGQWTVERANKWYNELDWLVGCNFVPSNAINQLEMWQEDTFSPELIDKELGWAEDLGFNTLRVFLHYLPWKEDKAGFYERVDQFLEICKKHNIRVMLIFFDDVWHPNPVSGKQPEPTKGVHNSGWVQSPGTAILKDLESHETSLKAYIQQTMERYAQDSRVLIWDLYNEPANPNQASYGDIELENKEQFSLKLLKMAFAWAREINPSQPICSDVWRAGSLNLDKIDIIDKFCYENSDVINFHSYYGPETTEKMVELLSASGRPLMCTEYMARTAGSTFETILPIFKEHKVAAYNWGLVNGKSNTIYPWHSWEHPFPNEPEIWFHDILREDGTPFSKEEVQFIKNSIGQKNLN
ncbi:cellulase family glycosylhydrolase [Flagellimonas pacifica]|uniref:Cellulase (Glycosyl hydrolase family 5) n=1 Tax=Flagellimonas pacifica TaxID=1247520 RepID=A0A285MYP4_9FLAO|nr:cellulase family glycosylhydrolase [Allomuricauda parva]SNZ01793.1 Cellulase (glycosyl hydrolase family 5) [Allomuricauda parva]